MRMTSAPMMRAQPPPAPPHSRWSASDRAVVSPETTARNRAIAKREHRFLCGRGAAATGEVVLGQDADRLHRGAAARTALCLGGKPSIGFGTRCPDG